WKDVVSDALQELGGEASLKEITAIAQQDPKAQHNTKVREKIRQVVRSYKIFQTVEEGSGIYRLVSEGPTVKLDPKATTKSVTDEIQGKLLYIGRVNNYETFAPADDRVKRNFAGQRLENFVSVRDFSEHPRLKKDEIKIIERIDVLWLAEMEGDLLPRFAFEIENATKVLTGLNRLNVIPGWFPTRLFIIGEDESQRKRYDNHLNGPTFKTRAERFQFRYFDEVRELFNTSKAYDEARVINAAAMKAAGLSE
ncbi:MAG TPA: hypothetical protein VFS10_12890, partial [Pyrinomonadaceae bacterium]|nr:hypothetical protein [Pyrinomonadaceae bacterium]